MANVAWPLRSVIRELTATAMAGLALVVLMAGLALVACDAMAEGTAGGPPRDRAARRQWALAQMNTMAQERLRCHERFRIPADVRECQAAFERRHRAYNEIYIEAARE